MSNDKETQFWEWFIANKNRLYEQTEPQKKLFKDLETQLHKVDTNLTFEFSQINAQGLREFTVSADGIKKHFPVVQLLISKAPKIEGWKISAFRQRIPSDSMTIECCGHKIGYDDIYFRYAHDSGKIALELNVKNLVDSPDFKNAIYILLDGLIGEYDMETQISSIDFILLDTNKIARLSPLIGVRTIVDENKKIYHN